MRSGVVAMVQEVFRFWKHVLYPKTRKDACDSNDPADLLVFLPVMYFRIPPTPSGVFYQPPTHRVCIANVYFLYVHDPTLPPFLQTYTFPPFHPNRNGASCSSQTPFAPRHPHASTEMYCMY